MEQMTIFQVFDELDNQDIDVEKQSREIIDRVQEFDSTLKVVAIYPRPAWWSDDEADFAIKENGKYRLGSILRDRVSFGPSWVTVRDELPNERWVMVR